MKRYGLHTVGKIWIDPGLHLNLNAQRFKNIGGKYRLQLPSTGHLVLVVLGSQGRRITDIYRNMSYDAAMTWLG